MADLRLSTIGDLTGRIALVTGGGTGIGLIMARGLAANGAKVYTTGRRKEKLDEAIAAPLQGNGHLVALTMDVLSKDSINDAVQIVQKADGKLDILINNAGVVGPYSHSLVNRSAPTLGTSLFTDHSFAEWDAAFASNTISPFFVTAAFLDLLQNGASARPGETSSVINITSCLAHTQLSEGYISDYSNFSNIQLAYCATKVALEHLTKSLATEFALHHIPVRINAIAPGTFPSAMTASRDVLAETMKLPTPGAFLPTPVLRPGRDEELAMTAVYLASSAGGYTNGSVVLIDGGWASVNPLVKSIRERTYVPRG